MFILIYPSKINLCPCFGRKVIYSTLSWMITGDNQLLIWEVKQLFISLPRKCYHFWIRTENLVALLWKCLVIHSLHIYSMWVVFPSFSMLVKKKRGIFSTSVASFLVPSGAWRRLEFHPSRKHPSTKEQQWGPLWNAWIKRWERYKACDCTSGCLNTCDSG